jgi:hypothetical protein
MKVKSNPLLRGLLSGVRSRIKIPQRKPKVSLEVKVVCYQTHVVDALDFPA